MREALAIILALGLLRGAEGLIIQVTEETPRCLIFDRPGTFNLVYVVSGEEQQTLEMVALSNTGQELARSTATEYSGQFTIQDTKELKVCFESKDSTKKVVEFDFFSESDPVRDIIDKKQVKMVVTSLDSAYQTLEAVERNQKFHIERDEIHKRILEDSESKIKFSGIVKILLLISSALVQLWVMKSFIKKGIPYDAVPSDG